MKFNYFYRLANYIKRFYLARKQNYRIIPLGTYCFSRTIATFCNLKPQKDVGEKTCPFDLAFFYDVNLINDLLLTRFKNFYNDLEYSNKMNCWVNPSLHAVFIHESKLSKEQFIARYNRRIKNFYSYIYDNKFKYFLIASQEFIPENIIIDLKKTILQFVPADKFKIILINQSSVYSAYNIENVDVIDQSDNYQLFQKINSDGDWIARIKKLDTDESKKIYHEITEQLRNIVK